MGNKAIIINSAKRVSGEALLPDEVCDFAAGKWWSTDQPRSDQFCRYFPILNLVNRGPYIFPF